MEAIRGSHGVAATPDTTPNTTLDAGLHADLVATGLVNDLWLVVATIMVFAMQAGFLMVEAGAVRSKNTISVAQKNIADFIACGCVFLLVGGPLMFGVGATGWFGWGGFDLGERGTVLPFLFHFAFCATAATIVSGAVAERMRFRAYLLLTILIGALVYPLFGRLAWGDALVAGNPVALADRGFLDFAGGTVVHVIGGAAALAAAILIGPRAGRFAHDGSVRPIRGHSSVLSNFGTMVLMFGWLGFNAGGAAPGSDLQATILLNTIVAMVFGGANGFVYGAMTSDGRIHPRSSTTGILGGLVAITSGCAFVDHHAAMLIGGAGGLAAVWLADELPRRFRIDDPVDAISVHLGAGVLGTVLIALFAARHHLVGSRLDQLAVQAGGAALAVAWAFGTTAVFLLAIGRWVPLRVSGHDERIGLNLAEHDAAFDAATSAALAREGHAAPAGGALAASPPVAVPDPLGETLGDGARGGEQIDALTDIVAGARAAQLRVRSAEARADDLATTDQLTGLLNRAAFRGALAAFGSRPFALVYLDLDGFKGVNDGFGHDVGDRALVEMAGRLREACPEGSAVSRFGGDEFVLAIPFGPSAAGGWADVCSRIVSDASEAIALDGVDLHLGASLGVAVFPDHSDDLDDLVLKADMALYEAKSSGKGRWVGFEPEMAERARRRTELEADMRAGLGGPQFHIHYQPQVCITTGRLRGFEALMRWDHPREGAVSPVEFIPAAERTGMIVELSENLIREACAVARDWPMVGGERCSLSVNISPVQFARSDVPAALERILHETGLDPTLLEIEVTESTLVESMESTKATLEAIRALGVRIAVDDFGTGYSSLSYLQGFPIDKLKVDRSFVRELESSASDQRIAKAIIDLGKSLGLSVIAEGVETEGQRRYLAGLECDEVQGFLFSPPVSPLGALDLIVKANEASAPRRRRVSVSVGRGGVVTGRAVRRGTG